MYYLHKKLKILKNPEKPKFLVGFFRWFFWVFFGFLWVGFNFWVGFLMPTLDILLVSLLNFAVFSLLMTSVNHDVPIVPAAAVISDFNSVPAASNIGLRKTIGCSPLLCSREPFSFSQKQKNNCILLYMYVYQLYNVCTTLFIFSKNMYLQRVTLKYFLCQNPDPAG